MLAYDAHYKFEKERKKKIIIYIKKKKKKKNTASESCRIAELIETSKMNQRLC
jgi:hypothetical protein